MQRWDVTWQVIKDVLLTGTGLALILSQAFSPSPSEVLLVAGLALTAPSVAGHARAILGGHDAHRPSSSPPRGSSPSGSSSPEDDRD